MKLAGEQWAGAQAEQLDRLEMFVCHFSDCLRFCFASEILFCLTILEVLIVSFVVVMMIAGCYLNLTT